MNRYKAAQAAAANGASDEGIQLAALQVCGAYLFVSFVLASPMSGVCFCLEQRTF